MEIRSKLHTTLSEIVAMFNDGSTEGKSNESNHNSVWSQQRNEVFCGR